MTTDRRRPAPDSAAQPSSLSEQLTQLREQLTQAQSDLARCRLALVAERHTARRDALTGLPNRNGFDAPSQRTMAAHGAGTLMLALLFVDLDGFKAVNDELGHAVGDELLRVVGARLANAMRRGDLVCRHGGDEFLCLLPQLRSSERAEAIALHLAETIAAPCQVGPHTLTVRASIGMAMYPRDGTTLPVLLRHADQAMYAAKSAGRSLAAPKRPAAACASALTARAVLHTI